MLRQLALAGAAGFILSACEHYGHDGDSGPKGANDTIDVTAAVKISRDSSGNFAFEYDAPFFDRKGNFDFSQDGAFGNAVNMSFEIADGSIDGLKFRSDPRDAIWIVEKE
ncbi:MAG: hypothetical protein R3C42_09715, partial [Parvularculaceae bacterium]